MAAIFTRALCTATVALLWATGALYARTVRVPLADGFDYAVGKPDGAGYYKFRGFMPNGHLGEDWNGRGGGDTDLGDPIYAIGDGVVVYSDNYRAGWGNVAILRHAFRDTTGKIQMVDSLYGHLHERKVKLYEVVKRGQLVGTMGSNNGMYAVHLHLEVRKNLRIGMQRSSFSRGFENYYRPSDFINANRTCPGSGLGRVEVPVDTFGQGSAAPAVELPTRSERSSFRTNSGGLSIPVYRSSGANVISTYQPGRGSSSSSKGVSTLEAINLEARARSSMKSSSSGSPSVRIITTSPGSSTTSSSSSGSRTVISTIKPSTGGTKGTTSAETSNSESSSGGSFWSRFRSKLQSGQTAPVR